MNILITVLCAAAVLSGLNATICAVILLPLGIVASIHSFKNRSGVHLPLFIFFALFCASYVVPVIFGDAKWGNMAIELSKIMYFFIPFILADKRRYMINGLFIGAVVESIIGILTFIGMYDIEGFVQIIDGVKHLQATTGYANTTCMIAVCGIFCGLYLSRLHKENKELYIFLSAICLIAALMTNSRLGIACAFAAVIIYGSLKSRRMRYVLAFLFFAGIAAVCILFLSGNERLLLGSTLVSRFIYWQDALLLFVKNPLGIGAGEWGELQYKIQTAEYSVNYVHNGYIQILIDAGITGFLSFIAMMSYALFKYIKKSLSEGYEIVFMCVIMLALHIFVDVDLSFSSIYLVLGVVLCTCAETSHGGFSSSVSIAAIILSSCILFLSAAAKPEQVTLQEAQQRYENGQLSVSDIGDIVMKTYELKAYGEMYTWSKRWIEHAPRHQTAYEMHYLALTNLYNATKNEIYQSEKEKLYISAENSNKTLNKLCKYLTAHREIILPGMK